MTGIVLVTGAGGFLGQRIVSSLLQQGVTHIRLHARRPFSESAMASWRQAHPGAQIEVVLANLLSRGKLGPLVEGVDCVIHAAAGMKGAAADMFANTVLASRNLLEAIGEHKVRRVVLISSFAVFKASSLPRGGVLDEKVPMELVGVERGAYGHAKTRQEQLFNDFQKQFGFESVVLRPGVIYGPGGGALSSRVGIKAMGFFVALGSGALLPLTYVDNCADAVATAALRAPSGSVLPVVDDDIPTCGQYLKAYRREVEPLRCIPLPYPLFFLAARLNVAYHKRSKGQLPAVFTPYVVQSMYRPLRYSNQALKALGWTPRVATSEGLQRAFAHFKAQLKR
jgi:nucleoside-diphosphate-sugar epimerase